jgi:hypothetical protein
MVHKPIIIQNNSINSVSSSSNLKEHLKLHDKEFVVPGSAYTDRKREKTYYEDKNKIKLNSKSLAHMQTKSEDDIIKLSKVSKVSTLNINEKRESYIDSPRRKVLKSIKSERNINSTQSRLNFSKINNSLNLPKMHFKALEMFYIKDILKDIKPIKHLENQLGRNNSSINISHKKFLEQVNTRNCKKNDAKIDNKIIDSNDQLLNIIQHEKLQKLREISNPPQGRSIYKQASIFNIDMKNITLDTVKLGNEEIPKHKLGPIAKKVLIKCNYLEKSPADKKF